MRILYSNNKNIVFIGCCQSGGSGRKITRLSHGYSGYFSYTSNKLLANKFFLFEGCCTSVNVLPSVADDIFVTGQIICSMTSSVKT